MEGTIEETINKLKESLRKYIEATYHIGHPSIIQQRRELLDQVGVISQNPYLESTPRYKTKNLFSGKIGLKISLISNLALGSFEKACLASLMYEA